MALYILQLHNYLYRYGLQAVNPQRALCLEAQHSVAPISSPLGPQRTEPHVCVDISLICLRLSVSTERLIDP